MKVRTVPQRRRLFRKVAMFEILVAGLEFVIAATGGIHGIRVLFVVVGALILLVAALLLVLSCKLAPGPADRPPPASTT